MISSRNNETTSGPNYNRLHGATSNNRHSNFGTRSASSPNMSRNRVHFNSLSNQEIPDERHNESSNQVNSSRHRSFAMQFSSNHDPELEEIMQHYGLSSSVPQQPQTFFPKNPPPHSEHNQRLAAFGVRLSEQLSHFIFAYPFIVLRRQCQINHTGRKYHLTPFTIFSVGLNMQRAQGFTCLWKGLGSCFVVSGISVGVDTVLSELPAAKLPREVSLSSSLSTLAKHFLLKTCSMLVVVPFYSSHLVESVQSEMVSETPGMFSVIVEGFRRLFGGYHSPRMLPFHKILLPTLTCAILKYVLTAFIQHITLEIMRWTENRRKKVMDLDPHTPPLTPAAEKSTSLVKNHYPEVISGLIAELIVDVILYPAETVINRINIQGTRTIIDNTDTGRGFLPVSSRYEGFWDCMSVTVSSEGYCGLYRGFGALLMQYTFKYAIARLTKFFLTISC